MIKTAKTPPHDVDEVKQKTIFDFINDLMEEKEVIGRYFNGEVSEKELHDRGIKFVRAL
ncbi:hypothetical protein [Dyadobacter chenhuakuii]|uniref:Uncharacterized protein n=1 Tax=Dyadobacter chenhuakuii TaxID=2909339 RepID=A0ABY5E8T6_9BACT|nr:hypothetical protein [Dyadobacter chenhuakuii]MCF2493366.1 hypothetical protein [Dyadobacter chenhuakuii]UTM21731.1 hypothetical protein NFI80_25145 [Dyadobacter chenhuakuii]